MITLTAVESAFPDTTVTVEERAAQLGRSDVQTHMHRTIHGLDTMAWAMHDKLPERCFGVGGRTVRTDPKYGNIFDHFSIVYEYENGVRGYHQCRHWVNSANRVKDYILGSDGTADVFGNSLAGKNKWRYRDTGDTKKYDMYQVEHDELFASIRDGRAINNGDYMAKSTLLAIMGRMATYTGQEITWEMAWNSKEDLTPPRYAWGPIETPPIAVPGITRYV